MGIKLKMARETLRIIIGTRNKANKEFEITNRRTRDNAAARMRLEAGPARLIRAASLRGLLRLKGSNWTGLPQPKRVMSIIRVPRGSRWATGFRVSLPWERGVGSPK